MACRSGNEDYEVTERNQKIKNELDEVTALLCSTVEFIRTRNTVLYNHLLTQNSTLASWHSKHVKIDQDRWYTHYRDTHSNFTRDEILKMVDHGILPKV